MNSARVHPSRWCLVGVGSGCSRQPAGWRSRQPAGRLRGFASPDVLKYRLAVFGVSVSNYSDSSPQAPGDLAKLGGGFLASVHGNDHEKDKVSSRRYIKCLLLALQVLCGGCRLGFVRAPLSFFMFPPLFGLCSRSRTAALQSVAESGP